MSRSLLRSQLSSPGVVRLVLAILVVVHHMSRLALGQFAVDVFFVLSGYWVALMYKQKHQGQSKGILIFYLSRYLRLIPLYVVCQAAMLLLMYVIEGRSGFEGKLGVSWLFRCLMLVGSASQQTWLVPSWSIDVEAQFYITLPFIVWMAELFPSKHRVLCLTVIGGVLLPLAFAAQGPKTPYLAFYLSFFLLGVSLVYKKEPTTSASALLSLGTVCAGVIGLLCTQVGRGLLLSGSRPADPNLLKYNCALCAVVALATLPFIHCAVRIKSTVADRVLGNTAYPVYLCHWLTQYAIVEKQLILANEMINKLVHLALVGGMTVALYTMVDKPAERLRYRIISRLTRNNNAKGDCMPEELVGVSQ